MELDWKSRADNHPPPLELPYRQHRPRSRAHTNASQPLIVSETRRQALQALCQAEQVDLPAVLLAALKVLLYRWTGQQDMALGVLLARPRADMLLVRTNLSAHPTFANLVHQVQQTLLNALAGPNLEREAKPERVLQVLFVFEDRASATLELAGPALAAPPLETDHVAVELCFRVQEYAQELTIALEYDRELFAAETIARMLGNYQTLLAAITDNAAETLERLPLLTRSEQQLLLEWNSTETPFPSRCIHTLLAEQVQLYPDAIAVEFETQQLTFGELEARANQLAHYLQARGVRANVLVGLCVTRSLELLVGLLGILKAGGAYVPLDPTYPPARLKQMLEDSQLSLLLTQRHVTNALTFTGPELIYLDEDWNKIALERVEPPRTLNAPESLAYTIYTSGSTGQPKGVQIPHRAATNVLLALRAQLGPTAQDIFLAITTLAFDIALLELVLPLLSGARLVIASRELGANAAKLCDTLSASAATLMQATPATWHMLVALGWKGHSRFKVLCGGDVLSPQLAAQLLTRSASFWNLYGPTETTIWSTAYRIRSADGPIPIGTPLSNTTVYVLDSNLQPRPLGARGELYIGGSGIAQGYVNRPDLTAQRFIPNPFDPTGQTRLYRTGDQVRFKADGTLEFWGRTDNQVKVRGFRIELEEIAANLLQHPAVQGAGVIVIEDKTGQKRLVAYYVPEPNATLTSRDLRDWLRRRLPEFMLPQLYVAVEALPLTPNQKVDRRALALLAREALL